MTDTQSSILVDIPEAYPHVMVVTLNRPPANPLTLSMFKELEEIFTQVAQRSEVRAIVLTGSGDRIFCAGTDVKEINERTVESSFQRSTVYRACYQAIRRCPVPVIGALNGTTLGAGISLAACCDFIIAAAGSRFGLPELTVGSMGGARHAGSLFPPQMMRYMALTGKYIDVEELHRVGGVLKVLPIDEVLPEALQIAEDIARLPPKMTAMMREAINLATEMSMENGYRLEQLFTNIAVALPESAEASKAFLEKREPKF